MDFTTKEIRIHIRWMIRRDIPEVLAIEKESDLYPWVEEDFLQCLRQRNCIGMVAEQGERVVGFMIYELHKARLHLVKFAVAAEFRLRGVGRQMLAKLMSKLSSHRRTRITLSLRERSLDGACFFRSMGFLANRVVRGFYDDSGEDAYLMEYRLADANDEEEDDESVYDIPYQES